jgi:uncharacterized protein DUF6599
MKAYNDALVEAGLTAMMERSYSDGHNEIRVILGQFRDPSGAYQAYTAELHPGMKLSSLGPLSAVDNSQLLALLGNLMLVVSEPKKISDSDLQLLVRALEERVDKTPLPPIRAYLPSDERVLGSEKYTLGPSGFQEAAKHLEIGNFGALAREAGFNEGAEAMLAQYRAGKDEGVLLLLDYPTPQLATYHEKHLELGLTQISKLKETPIERRGSLLMMVLSPSSQAYAEKLRKSVNYETQVTWNEPTHTLTDPPWARVLINIFIGTGVFMVAAVVLGVAFGGVRVVTKIFLPGKIFDRPERMEILQLGLSGKRIDPRDFY